MPPAARDHACGAPLARRGTRRPSGRQVIRWGIGLVVACGLLLAVFAAAGGAPAELQELRRTRLLWLAPAVAAEAISFALYGAQLRRLSGRGGQLGWSVWAQVGLIVYGLGRLAPAAPAEGVVFSAFQLQRHGMARRRAGLALVLGLWTQFWALVLVFAIGIAAVAGSGHLHVADAAAFALSALTAAIAIAAATAPRRRGAAEGAAQLFALLPRRWRKSRAESRELGGAWRRDIEELATFPRAWGAALLAATAAMVSDAACLWMALVSCHTRVGFGPVIAAYALASLASWIPFLPAGAGVVEAVAPAVLHHYGVPLLAALTATVIWRALSLLLPAVGGAAAAFTLHATRPAAPDSGPARPVQPLVLTPARHLSPEPGGQANAATQAPPRNARRSATARVVPTGARRRRGRRSGTRSPRQPKR